MNINVYLPDELGQKAKAAGIQFSSLLRAAVHEELERIQTVAESREHAKEIILDLKDQHGRSYKGRFTGRLLAAEGNYEVYQRVDDDEDRMSDDPAGIILYDADSASFETSLGDIGGELLDTIYRRLGAGAYADVMHAIGEDPIIDI